MQQIPTTHSPITQLLKTPRTEPLQISWVDLHICFWFLKRSRIIFPSIHLLRVKEQIIGAPLQAHLYLYFNERYELNARQLNILIGK